MGVVFFTQEKECYAGFNLVVGDLALDSVCYYCNRSPPNMPRRLGAGLYGVSNGLLGSPWEKVERGKSIFHSLLEQGEEGEDSLLASELIEKLLKDATPCSVEHQQTGYPPCVEAPLAKVFIPGVKPWEEVQGADPLVKDLVFGTVCHTIVLVDYQGHVTLFEQSMDSQTFKWAPRATRFDFDLEVKK